MDHYEYRWLESLRNRVYITVGHNFCEWVDQERKLLLEIILLVSSVYNFEQQSIQQKFNVLVDVNMCLNYYVTKKFKSFYRLLLMWDAINISTLFMSKVVESWMI